MIRPLGTEESRSIAEGGGTVVSQKPDISVGGNLITVWDFRNFMLKNPLVVEEAEESESREQFLRGKAFAFWADPSEDGYSLDDGDPPER
jgi:hypothetical protein